jgi:hypothetical protein
LARADTPLGRGQLNLDGCLGLRGDCDGVRWRRIVTVSILNNNLGLDRVSRLLLTLLEHPSAHLGPGVIVGSEEVRSEPIISLCLR